MAFPDDGAVKRSVKEQSADRESRAQRRREGAPAMPKRESTVSEVAKRGTKRARTEPSAPELSAYEQQRDERKAQNNRKLEELGLA